MGVATEIMEQARLRARVPEDCIEAMSGPHDGERFPLGSGQNLIGRDEAAAVSLRFDASVSRHHAYVRLHEDDTYRITDPGSTNGTFVGGTRVEPQKEEPLRPGELFRAGDTLLMLRRKES
jgi:pSer/pThr/pTyr-binding forkhead associated (FHA) protein